MLDSHLTVVKNRREKNISSHNIDILRLESKQFYHEYLRFHYILREGVGEARYNPIRVDVL
jgi:hypothetical protein